MRCLRKQIKSTQGFQYILSACPPSFLLFSGPRNDLPNVPRLRVHVTADVHDRLRAKGEQLPYERLVAPLARRVYDERGEGGRKVADDAEDLRGVARTEGDFVREAVQRRVVRRKADRVRGELDAGHLCEVWGEGEREEPRAAVGVDEVSRGRGARRGRGSRWEDGIADV